LFFVVILRRTRVAGERFCSLGWHGGGPAFAFVFALAFAFLLSSFAEGGGPAFALAFVFAPALAHSSTQPPRSTMPSTQQIKSSFRPAPEQVKRVEGAVEKSASPPAQPNHPHRRITKNLLIPISLFIALTLSPPPIRAQGCTQCLDNTAATPPATQRGYRRAIILLTLTAGGLFATTLALFKRHR
jgi:hypothetical protein